jgi:phosphoglucosamine mutase
MTAYPQRLINLRVRERRDLAVLPGVAETIRAAEASLGDRGRVLVRYSGTELVARVMVEGESSDIVDEHAQSIANAIRGVLGTDRPSQAAPQAAKQESKPAPAQASTPDRMDR